MYIVPPLKWQGWHLAANIGLTWVVKSIFAASSAEPVAGFVEESAGIAETGTVAVVVVVLAFVWLQP